MGLSILDKRPCHIQELGRLERETDHILLRYIGLQLRHRGVQNDDMAIIVVVRDINVFIRSVIGHGSDLA